MAAWLASASSTGADDANAFISAFVNVTDSAMENINPANFAQHEALALLIGRPMAVVRIQLDLRIQGLGPFNQNLAVQPVSYPFGSMTSDSQGNIGASADAFSGFRVTNNYENVQFPIRIGEEMKLNDGVVGYWIESATDQYSNNTFYSPQSTQTGYTPPTKGTPTIVAPTSSSLPPITQSIADKPLNLTMLIDPRGPIHATTGVLPTQALSLPPSQYAHVLKNIAVTFLTSPILTPNDTLQLPTPNESGFQWSWLERGAQMQWETLTPSMALTDAKLDAASEIVEGWLKLSPTSSP